MIIRFVNGPWDGKEMEFPDDNIPRMYNVAATPENISFKEQEFNLAIKFRKHRYTLRCHISRSQYYYFYEGLE